MKKWVIEIKLKKENYARNYYSIKQSQFGIEQDQFWIMIDNNDIPKFFNFKNIEHFKIIEQAE
jgi:hypothetical protein